MLTPPYGPIAEAIAALHPGIQTATKYIDAGEVARATYRQRPTSRSRRVQLIVTYGEPNYLEKRLIALCKQAGEPFPVRKVQLKPWPRKRVLKNPGVMSGHSLLGATGATSPPSSPSP